MSLTGSGSTFHGWLGVIADNHVGARGEGGGVYVGDADGTRLELSDTTVAGNTVGAGGSNPGLGGGGGGDHLQLFNSIVFNSPMPDIGGFSTIDGQYSDACQPTARPSRGRPTSAPTRCWSTPPTATSTRPRRAPRSTRATTSSSSPRRRAPTPTSRATLGRPTATGTATRSTWAPTRAPRASRTPSRLPRRRPRRSAPTAWTTTRDGAVDQADPGCLSGPGESYNAADANEGDEGLRELVLCGRRPISLVRADARGKRVVLRGLVGEAAGGPRVTISVRFLRGGARGRG